MAAATRELVIYVDIDAEFPFTVQTWADGGMLGSGWHLLQEIKTRTFPRIALERVSERLDYQVRVRYRNGVLCESCGGVHPKGQSCGCHDNGGE